MVIDTNRRSLLIGLGASAASVASYGIAAGIKRTTASPTEGGDSLAPSAPALSLVTDIKSYPPQIDFERPVDWHDGDTAVLQRSQDPSFAAGVSETTQTISASAASYDFGLSSVTSGTWYFRMAAWRGARPAHLNWSPVIGTGSTTAMAITTAASFTVEDGQKVSIPLTANQPGSSITAEGHDGSHFEVVGAPGSQTLRLAGDASADVIAKSAYAVTLVATNPMGVSSSKEVTVIVHSDAVFLNAGAKSHYIRLSNSNLSASGTGYVGAVQGVRATGMVDTFTVQITGGDPGTGGVLAIGFDDETPDLDAMPNTIGRGDANSIGMNFGNYGFEVWSKTRNLAAQYSKGWKVDKDTVAKASRDPKTAAITFSISFDAGKTWTVLHTVTGADAKLDRYYPVLALFTATTVTANFKGRHA